jgi:hypothetical protein
MKELRCQGINKKSKICEQLLYKYKVIDDEVIIETKCGSCNTFTVLRIQIPIKSQDKNIRNYGE